MDFKEARLELHYSEAEKIYQLDTGINVEEWQHSNRTNRLCRVLSTIKKSPFTVTCCLVQVICFCLENEEIIALFCYSPSQKDQLWRGFTYAFFHSNLYHLITNLLFLLLVGIILEHDQGSWRTFAVYTSGIISGAFGCNIFTSSLKVIGTSAASYSLLTAHISHIKMNWPIVRYKDYRIAIVSCLLLSDIISYFLYLFILKNVEVSWNSHFAAGINGLLISGILFHSYKPMHSYRYLCVSVYMVLLTFSIIIYVPWLTNFVSKYSNHF